MLEALSAHEPHHGCPCQPADQRRMCLACHLKGTGNQRWGCSPDHRTQSESETDELITLCRKHYKMAVKVWTAAVHKIAPSKKLSHLYLANDVVQNSKKKHPEIAKEFGSVMQKVCAHLASLDLEEKVIKSIARLLKIWKERSIFDPKVQAEMDRIWATKAMERRQDDGEQKGEVTKSEARAAAAAAAAKRPAKNKEKGVRR